jgi:hypothetical protein
LAIILVLVVAAAIQPEKNISLEAFLLERIRNSFDNSRSFLTKKMRIHFFVLLTFTLKPHTLSIFINNKHMPITDSAILFFAELLTTVLLASQEGLHEFHGG